MALIVCPDCGKSFSDRAAACPECGCPTSEVTGQSSNANVGQISIANNAFEDGRYDEAYQLFAQIYAQDQKNPQVLFRLGLATAAKDYFNNGIPNSTKDLVARGLDMAKVDGLAKIALFVADAQKVIEDTKAAVLEGLSSAIQQTAPMRGVGSMVADALFSPVVSANRNLYEDRRTAEANSKILNNAIANKKVITATLDTFGSYVLKIVADMLTDPLDNDNPLYTALGDFVANGDDAKIYEKLSASATPLENVYGLCYGQEETIFSLDDVWAVVRINGKVQSPGFNTSGKFTLTNYKVTYKAKKDKQSFEKALDCLVEVVGDSNYHLLILRFGAETEICLNPKKGREIGLAALVNEKLKMPNR